MEPHQRRARLVSFQTFRDTPRCALQLAVPPPCRRPLPGRGRLIEETFDTAVNDIHGPPSSLFWYRLAEIFAQAALEGTAPMQVVAADGGSASGSSFAGSRPYWLGREVVIFLSDSPLFRAMMHAP